MRGAQRIHIGTSGWHYSHWMGPFYPEKLAAERMLAFYGTHFHTVEINNSFYQLPAVETLQRWREDSPPDFLFSIKASRYITHMKKLKDPDATLPALLDRIQVLQDKQGPLLFQLPPKWHFNKQRLQEFAETLPGSYRYVFEFRDPSWFDSSAYQVLEKNGIAFCIYELAGRSSPKQITADFVYIRLHGPADAYQGSYDSTALAGWAGAFATWAGQGKEIFCYFDNDQSGYAAQNALQLQQMITGSPR